MPLSPDHLNSMLQQKCTVGDCQEKQAIFLTVPNPSNSISEVLPFCLGHAEKFMILGAELNEASKKVQAMIERSDGSMVCINSWDELVRKLKPEFLEIATKGLEMTKGLCVDCGKPAFGIRTFLTPVCGECYGFPRNVLRCALK